jgi:phosphoribosylaminoimidazolecarboxamide formyltransferase/IMP cyclohydrolase
LISVSDKTGLEAFAARLVAAGVELVASSGTAAALAEAGIVATTVEELTGVAAMLGGRVKTLHPRIHAALLGDRADASHKRDLAEAGIVPFDLVVANLYPFAEVAAEPGLPDRAVVEQIDIGGVAMLRAAAKNHRWVAVVTTPDQYEEAAAVVEAGGFDDDQRRALAAGAFFHTAAYDAAIVGWFSRNGGLPNRLVAPLVKVRDLPYGENPHQAGAVYVESGTEPWWAAASQLRGKALSFNNMADAEAAWRLVWDLDPPAAVVIKHTNPAGAATADSILDAMEAAWDGDAQAAYGGVIALNRPLDAGVAGFITGRFVAVVIAPSVDDAALDLLSSRKGVRVLEAPAPQRTGSDLRRVESGILVQHRDDRRPRPDEWEHAAGPAPDERVLRDLRLAWTVAAHASSNAVALAKAGVAVGIGAGNQSRVGAARVAIDKAGERAAGAVAAGDGFFPFRDGLDLLADAGVTAVVAPGGSIRDQEVATAAEERAVTLLLSDRRHFRH